MKIWRYLNTWILLLRLYNDTATIENSMTNLQILNIALPYIILKFHVSLYTKIFGRRDAGICAPVFIVAGITEEEGRGDKSIHWQMDK